MTEQELRRTEYWAKKVDGVCTRIGCNEAAGDESVLCAAHQQKQRQYKATSQKRPGPKQAQRRGHRAHKLRRQRAGLCYDCGRGPLATKRLCERCRRKKLKAVKSTSTKPPPPCSKCGERGHYAKTCTRGWELSEIEVRSYALARVSE